MSENPKRGRQRRGRAWHWKQTDCWYYTVPGTKRRVPLVDEDGKRIRGKENRNVAEMALARVKLSGKWRPELSPASEGEWVVARVCSEYLQHCKHGVAAGTMSQGYCEEAVRRLNQLCDFCGALPVSQLRQGQVKTWVESHATWRSPATRRNVIAIVLAAFNHAAAMHDLPNPLRGLKKPPAQPRLHSLSAEEEEALLAAADGGFRDFLFAAIRTGLRPFCELARLTAENVVETEWGMMWRVYASKTKKTRKVPVRPEIAELTRQLMQTAPKGSDIPLFRNTQGKAWTPVNGRGRFQRLKKKVGWDQDPIRRPYWDRRCIRLLLGNSRRKVRRTRAEIERERRELLEKTNREIDAIVQEYHAKLPQHLAKAIGALYARYSSRFQDSIADQVRTLFEAAYRLGIFIPREFVFFDMAVRGWKDRRPGLTALRQAIGRKAFDVFLVFSTSRLFRRTYKALQFVEEELVERGIRGVFVKSHLDTADGEAWRTTFQLFAAMDETQVRMYADHVRAAHEGLFLRGMVYGSLPLGYTGQEMPGEFTKRKRPRRKIVVDPETAPWVKRIFRWFVEERLTLDEITRRLNEDPDAPAPNKSLTGWWTHALVRRHLTLAAYRGYWVYGAAQTKWSSEKDYAQRELREEPLKSGQFEDLRIVSDELWYAAQKRLAERATNSGRKSKDGRKVRCRLLRQLFVCPEHNRQLVVGGAGGSILFCPICRAIRAEERPLFSHLNRVLALRLTGEKLSELVRLDEALVSEIIVACQREAEAAQRPNPEIERQLRARLEKINRTIEFNRRNPGDTEDEQKQTETLLKQLRDERAGVLADLSHLEAAKQRVITPPTPEFVALSEKAKALYDEGLMHVEIARQLGCARSYVTKLLKDWFESRGHEDARWPRPPGEPEAKAPRTAALPTHRRRGDGAVPAEGAAAGHRGGAQGRSQHGHGGDLLLARDPWASRAGWPHAAQGARHQDVPGGDASRIRAAEPGSGTVVLRRRTLLW